MQFQDDEKFHPSRFSLSISSHSILIRYEFDVNLHTEKCLIFNAYDMQIYPQHKNGCEKGSLRIKIRSLSSSAQNFWIFILRDISIALPANTYLD